MSGLRVVSDGSQESSADWVSSNGEVQSCEYQWVTEGMPNGMACPECLQSEVRIWSGGR